MSRTEQHLELNDRDRRMLAFAAEHRYVLAGQIARLLSISERAATTRLRQLRKAGYVRNQPRPVGQPAFQSVTTKGLRAIDSDLPRPRDADLSVHRHDTGVGWLMVAAERGKFGPLDEIVSERRMRSHDGRRAPGEPPFGVRLGGVGWAGAGMRERLHYPDMLVVTATGHRVAFELELTTKTPRKRERILAAYAMDRRIDAVVYLVDTAAARQALERSVARVGIGDRVRVEQVALGRRPSADPAQRTTQHSRRPERGRSR